MTTSALPRVKLYNITPNSMLMLNVVGVEGGRLATFTRLDGSYGHCVLVAPLPDGRTLCQLYFAAEFILVDGVYHHVSLCP